MKILFDTNLLVPAWLYKNGVCAKAYDKAVNDKNISLFVCTHILGEFLKTCNEKFPDKMDKIQLFLNDMLTKAKLIKTPPERERIPEEDLIRDIDDRPVLRAAIAAEIDIIVTGDKDFLEAGLTNIKVISPAEFLKL